MVHWFQYFEDEGDEEGGIGGGGEGEGTSLCGRVSDIFCGTVL